MKGKRLPFEVRQGEEDKEFSGAGPEEAANQNQRAQHLHQKGRRVSSPL